MEKTNNAIVFLICLVIAFLGGFLLHSGTTITEHEENVSEAVFEEEEQEQTGLAEDKPVTGKVITHVTLTTYNAVKAQTNEDSLTTASGMKIDLNRVKNGTQKYCAVSKNLLYLLPYGSIIHIEGHGYYIVADTMHPRFNHYIDILQDVSKPNFKKEKVKITLIRKGYVA
jgi:3D (Asp-Asp-Asp) domain-containing protein